MTGFRRIAVLAAICIGSPASGWGQTLTTSGDPAPLTIATAEPGSPPDAESDNTTTYDVTTAATTARISARLDAALPPGVMLEVELQAPPGATSAGPVALTTLDQDVVIGIPPFTSATALQITYTLSALAAAGVVGPRTPTVLFTLVSP